ncbi:hypothetical protein [Mycobacteroides abscessus]|uniref:hypothetical protein n=1 Tax=Mycobacteroides abscessus TaxID=36809 RepID=UPI001041C9CF|nr:hypothetical protein [Mycobacteroides abscessus]
MRKIMRRLPNEWCKLKLTIGEKRSRGAQEEVSRRPKPGSKVLINVDTAELMGEIVLICDEATRGVLKSIEREHRRGYPALGRSTADRYDFAIVLKAVDVVTHDIGVLASSSEGVMICLKLLDLAYRIRRHLGETLYRERQHLPCPSCGELALVKEVQDKRGRVSSDDQEDITPEVIRCLACNGGPNQNGTWTETEYRWLAKMVLSEREEHEMLKWLLAEAQWKGDVNAWLAAERLWLLDLARATTGMPMEDFIAALERSVT